TTGKGVPPPPPARTDVMQFEEAISLAQAIDLHICRALIQPIRKQHPATLFGTGIVKTLQTLIQEARIHLLIVNASLTPIQQRNLENQLQVKVLDRTGLILEIFGARAATREGRLQVELAHLTYQKSRLVRSWTHLERQRGGTSSTGGPGETQIESDRRMIQAQITRVKKRLDSVIRTRNLHRTRRAQIPWPIIALIGYTNVGKSTLFNRLTQAQVVEKDMLFTTLDPSLRALKLPTGGQFMLADTVGFVSDLPPMLVAAFRATLEEVLTADILIHVRDIAHADTQAQRDDVRQVLAELGVAAETPIIEFLNKADRLDSETQTVLENRIARHNNVRHNLARHNNVNVRTHAYDSAGDDNMQAQIIADNNIMNGGNQVAAVLGSAQTGQGIDGFLATLSAIFESQMRPFTLTVPPHMQGEILAYLHRQGQITQQDTQQDGSQHICVKLSPAAQGYFEKHYPALLQPA
ncbi:MAG: GTPase HflX, partial [Alphaproteobacteria bacterium]|nr:GTPase HflX [Alphaproteobacteria bacterium]